MTAILDRPRKYVDRLSKLDFKRHNEEQAAVWKAFNEGKPIRTPVILGIGTRFYMMHPQANDLGISFRQYMENPDVMFEAQLRFQRWARFNLLYDTELGLPEKWTILVDFQNYYEAAWFGCQVHYLGDQVPDTFPDFAECPEKVMDKGLPDPFGGIMARGLEFWEHFKARCEKDTYLDRPITTSVPWFGIGTDGPFTVACNLFGPSFVCETLLAEPERMQKLLSFITEATIARIVAWRRRGGIPVPMDGAGFADDSIAMISTETYREHVLPHHKRMLSVLGTDKPNWVHLCGDATRHFLLMRDELNIRNFDTGFPVDFGALRKTLGPDVRIQGGPHIGFLRSAKPLEVCEEVRRIMSTGVLEGGQFVLREGNNLAPGTPLENTEALYFAGKEYGRFDRCGGCA
jgi:uroporphyrinogen-III decarboxylase